MSDTFQSLQSRNFRRYFIGLTASMAGSWMQIIAQAALVLELTHSASQLGYIAAAQMVPVLLLAPSAGVLVDRVKTRHLILATQILLGLIALLLGLLTMSDNITLWMVYAAAMASGVLTAVDQPARQAFVSELVPKQLLTNAITLSTVSMNAARAIGPAIAGIVIVKLSIGACFLLNGLSYVAVVVALLFVRVNELHERHLEPRRKGQLREGLSYAWKHPQLRVALLMMTIVGTFTYEFQVTLPALADQTFSNGDGSGVYAWLTGIMGLGAVIGGLITASRPRNGLRPLIAQSVLFGISVLAVAIAPTEKIALVALLFSGASSITLISRGSATVQLLSEPAKRGRVMALWTMAFIGTTPIGAPICGWIADYAGARWALGMGAVAALTAGGYGALAQRRLGRNSISFEAPVTAMASP